jgi:acid phosphatase family membrane protein YuiD
LESFIKILYNKALIIPVLSFFTAQLVKVIIESIKCRRFVKKRFVGSGGMPSSHASFVSSLATCIGMLDGFDSTTFAISFVAAIVVMYDAAGVRRAAGTHARIINSLRVYDENDSYKDLKLREEIGHTPLEVMIGSALGIFISFILTNI